MTTHTPGPWNRHEYGYLVGPDADTPIYLRNATNLLAGSDALVAEAEANMTLCSAAPELLEALRNFTDGCSTSINAMEVARAAIAKATGA